MGWIDTFPFNDKFCQRSEMVSQPLMRCKIGFVTLLGAKRIERSDKQGAILPSVLVKALKFFGMHADVQDEWRMARANAVVRLQIGVNF
jgi:hypothetical protein